MGLKIIESVGASIVSGRTFTDPFTKIESPISARSLNPRSFATTIRADIGENEAYKEALRRGEIGLQRPFGVNVAGVDFITAKRSGESGVAVIICTDVKTSQMGRFGSTKKTLPGSWRTEVSQAVGRLSLKVEVTDFPGAPLHSFSFPATPAEIALLENAIRLAMKEDRILRQPRRLKADYSLSGQGTITGW